MEDFNNFGNNLFSGMNGKKAGKTPGKMPKVGKHMKHVALGVAGIVVIGILAGDASYQIQEQEQAVLTTFGVPKAVTETGLHFKVPFIQKVQKVNTTIQGFPIGYDIENNETVENEGVMITSDYNFIDVDFFVEYRIADPVKYLYTSEEPENILKNISQSCIRTVIASYKVDDVLTTGKSEIQSKIKEMIMNQVEEQDIGIQLVNITIQDSEPPTQEVMRAFKAVESEIQSKIKEMIMNQVEEQDIGIQLVNITIQDSEPPTQEVMRAFKAVETAKQGKETALNNANKYRNEKIPEAEAKADQIIQDAEAEKEVRINEAELNNANKYRNEKIPEAEAKADQIIQDAEAEKEVRINEAEAEVARFNAMYEEYSKNPEVTKKRMFYEAMEDVLPQMKIVIDSGYGVQKVLPLESFVSTMEDSGKENSAEENSTETAEAEVENNEN